MDLNTPLIRRLRDHLLDVAPSSIAPPAPTAEVERITTRPTSPEEDAVVERFRPFAELFYLVASSDGEIDTDERLVMRGAFEALTGGRVGRERLLVLEAELISQAADRDREDLLERVCSVLSQDREDAELAYTLAAVVAYANRSIDAREQELVEQVAAWLGISGYRANALLVSGNHSIHPGAP